MKLRNKEAHLFDGPAHSIAIFGSQDRPSVLYTMVSNKLLY